MIVSHIQPKPYELKFVQTQTTTISNTTDELSVFGTGIGSRLLTPNFLRIGRTLRLSITGHISANVGVDSTVNIKLGSTTLVTSTSSISAALSQRTFFADFDFTCITEGTSGTIIGQGHTIIFGGLGIVTLSGRGLTMTTPAIIDTTIEQLIDATYTWSAADAGNALVSTNVLLELLK